MKQKKVFDKSQKSKLVELAKVMLRSFEEGFLKYDELQDNEEAVYGRNYFPGFAVLLLKEYTHGLKEFTSLAAKMLKSRSGNEKTIGDICQKACQEFIRSGISESVDTGQRIESAAKRLVEDVLAESNRKYVFIHPNYIVRHPSAEIVRLGPVRSMPAGLAVNETALKDNKKIAIVVEQSRKITLENDVVSISMPPVVWVVDVEATKENVPEEAKWLIDVALSFMRFSTNKWSSHWPRNGDLEMHPIFPPNFQEQAITIEGSGAVVSGGRLPGWYEIDEEVASDLGSKEIQRRADVLFNAPKNSLGKRVAQGLGWITRGRHATDRAERLLNFFTALEALLTADDKSSPVGQTICRNLSVVIAKDIPSRPIIFDDTRMLYDIRSSLVHAGVRDVLWQHVDKLQMYTEAAYCIVLKKCDLNESKDAFIKSISQASHGFEWKAEN